jgi:hypothetical protein
MKEDFYGVVYDRYLPVGYCKSILSTILKKEWGRSFKYDEFIEDFKEIKKGNE